MTRTVLVKILCVLITVILLLCGCGKKLTAYLYVFEDNEIVEKQISVKELSYISLLDALKENGVVNDGAAINNFENTSSNEFRTLKLEMNKSFSGFLSSRDAQTQELTVQCVADTFLKNYGAEEIIFTVDGEPLTTEKGDFSKISFVSAVKVATATPDSGESEAPATGTPLASDIPTFAPTATPTVAPTVALTAVPIATSSLQKDPAKKYIALSFDDGPHNQYTRLIAEKLKEYGAHATFFVVGNRINSTTADAMKFACENGSEIQIHGYTHEAYYNKCSDDVYNSELSKTAAAIEDAVGITPTLMRPIGGSITDSRVASSKYGVIIWNIDSEDWKHKKGGDDEINIIVNNVMKDVSDGSIILMHEIYQNSYKAFCIILDKLYQQGYEVVTVSELIGNVQPGKKYYRGY